jgi:hypothetical protein
MAPLHVANATLISVDLIQGSGDGLITRDTESGLDWLDLTTTANQTYDQVRNGSWYQAGFRHALQSEVQTLFTHAGMPDQSSTAYPAEAQALVQLLGATFPPGEGGSVRTAGFTGTDFFGNTVTTATHPIGIRFDALRGKVDYLNIESIPLVIGQAHFSGDQPFSDEAFPFYGSFLITPSPVPIPGAAILFATGVIGLVGLWKRNERRHKA